MNKFLTGLKSIFYAGLLLAFLICIYIFGVAITLVLGLFIFSCMFYIIQTDEDSSEEGNK
jgi:hypothetical protein